MTFLPLRLHQHGFAVSTGGLLLTAYLALGALGGFLGGWLADRWGGRRVVVGSFLGATPLYFAFLYLPDVPGLVCLILGSFVLQASLPVNVVLGQELSPRHSSTISSLLMGAAWGMGFGDGLTVLSSLAFAWFSVRRVNEIPNFTAVIDSPRSCVFNFALNPATSRRRA